MGFDIALIALILGGVVLSIAYVSAEYRIWREQRAAQRRREAALRDLHAASFSEQRDALLPSVMKLQGFGASEAANPDGAGEFSTPRRTAGQKDPRTFPLGERRKRVRQRATR